MPYEFRVFQLNETEVEHVLKPLCLTGAIILSAPALSYTIHTGLDVL